MQLKTLAKNLFLDYCLLKIIISMQSPSKISIIFAYLLFWSVTGILLLLRPVENAETILYQEIAVDIEKKTGSTRVFRQFLSGSREI